MTVMRIYHFELFFMVMMQVNKCRFFTKKFLLKRSLKLLVILLCNIPATGLHYEKHYFCMSTCPNTCCHFHSNFQKVHPLFV